MGSGIVSVILKHLILRISRKNIFLEKLPYKAVAKDGGDIRVGRKSIFFNLRNSKIHIF
jgi:hypothetical protein